MRLYRLILRLIWLPLGLILLSCLWDNDTVEMERQRFPEVIELLSGKFLRHSPEFYYWRIQDRRWKLRQFPDSLNLYDDLAVAYSKLGNDSMAIQLMEEIEVKFPERYETLANLGTFYIHDGQLEKGLTYIQKAIAVNPDAHFGREIYQQYLVEYVLEKRRENGKTLPLAPSLSRPGQPAREGDIYRMRGGIGFYAFLLAKEPESGDGFLPRASLENAIRGISGMIKFGNSDSPVLLEALGDLMLGANYVQNVTSDNEKPGSARHLAARAYLKAAYQMEKAESRQAYYRKATDMLILAHPAAASSLEHLHETFLEELEEGSTLFASIQEDEISWIRSGMDPEAEFQAKYYDVPWLSERGEWAYDGDQGQAKSFREVRASGHYGTPEMDAYRIIQAAVPDSAVVSLIDSLHLEKLNPDMPSDETDASDGGLPVPNWLFALLLIGVVGMFFRRLRVRKH